MEKKILETLKPHWEELCVLGQKLTFRKGQVLFYEGHNPYGIFILQSGKVKFSQGENYCETEHLIPSPKGKVIGLSHFTSESPSCCSCIATTDCSLIFISKTQLQPLLAQSTSCSHKPDLNHISS